MRGKIKLVNSLNIEHIIKFSFFLIPIPVFFDFAQSRFHLSNLLLYPRTDHLGFPFPLGAVVLFFFYLIKAKSVTTVFFNKKRFLDYLVLGLIFAYLMFCIISDYSFISILQLISFPLILWYATFIDDEKLPAKGYLAGLFIFSVGHAVSLLMSIGWGAVGTWDRMLWERFFNFEIYQGLVSYVNVLGMTALVALWLFIFSTRKLYSLYYASAFCLLLYLAALSSQRAYVLDLILITVLVFILIVLFKNITIGKKYALLVMLIIVWLLSVIFVGNNWGSPVKRLYSSISNILTRNYDGDSARYFSQRSAILEVKELSIVISGDTDHPRGFSRLVRGTGVVHTGAHNFILDQLVGVGILGTVCYFLCILLLYIRIIHRCWISESKISIVFLLILALMCGAACLVNSPLTQPLYFCNLVVCALFFANKPVLPAKF